MQLPEVFTEQTRRIMGEELFAQYLASFDEPTPVSIRVNPFKTSILTSHDQISPLSGLSECEKVPWCEHGHYLPSRPNFTFDPLLHAGCYYVQEASSMFLAQIMKQHVKGDVTMLDLCAAPGGKSTCARTYLTDQSVLICNEPIRTRANILYENVTKFGVQNTFVTNCYPADFKKSKLKFDVILADVPCSGEGMFRKDNATIGEWSEQNVEKCWRLQREIVADIWGNLADGGLLIYSTCTFNTKEDEENVQWICRELGAECLSVETEPEWNIVGSLFEGFNEPVYRFIPGHARGEGIFFCVMRKHGVCTANQKPCVSKQLATLHQITPGLLAKASSVAEALSTTIDRTQFTEAELNTEQAIAYLRREALTLPKDTPKGMVLVTYCNVPLGFAKNIGNRANNLYPQPWAIRKELRQSQSPTPAKE